MCCFLWFITLKCIFIETIYLQLMFFFQSGLVNIMCGYGVQESPVSTAFVVNVNKNSSLQ